MDKVLYCGRFRRIHQVNLPRLIDILDGIVRLSGPGNGRRCDDRFRALTGGIQRGSILLIALNGFNAQILQ
jgi:hypothetical protein